MAVMTDVREAAQGLIEYAIHRSMIGQDDRIWAYNTILECIGATGPALDMAWALQVEKLSLLHPDTLPDFDLEGTLAALSEAAVANGAAEDTASGRDRIAMRIMGVLMPRPSVVNEEFNGRMGVNEPRAATDWFYGLCCDAGYVRRAAIARNIKWSTSTNWGDLRSPSTCPSPRKTRAILPQPVPPKTRARSIPPVSSASRTRATPDAPPQPTAALIPPVRTCALFPFSSTASAGASSTARMRILTSTALR